MLSSSTLGLLSKNRLFENTTPEAISKLNTDYLHFCTYEAGTVLMEQEGYAKHIILLLSGKVGVWRKLPDGTEVQVNTLGARCFLGELGLLLNRVHTAKVVTSTRVRAVLIDASAYEYIKSQIPQVIDNVMRNLINTLQATDDLFACESLRSTELASLNEVIVAQKAELEKAHRELNAAYEQLKRIASTDHLTKLLNRRVMLERIEDEINRKERMDYEFCLILGDIDHFKLFNDKYGHDCGDHVLQFVAKTITTTVRKTDLVSRWGGEEFLIMLPGTELSGAMNLAEKVRHAIEHTHLKHRGQRLSVTMTFGVGKYHAHIGLNECLRLVDQALYQGKENGRNRVESAGWL